MLFNRDYLSARLRQRLPPVGYAIAVAAARAPEVSSGKKRDKTDGKPFEPYPLQRYSKSSIS
jgi:hypothetical protein